MWEPSWPGDKPIVDAIAPDGDFNAVTGALAAVGLGSVPAWLRPYPVLSRGEQFRADLAKLVSEAPDVAVVDEFTSVVDRQIAQIGSLVFSKAWRRIGGQVVLLTPHYGVLDWLQPDWVFDTATGQCSRGWVRPRPTYDLEIYQTGWEHWGPTFERHHYLKLPRMIGAKVYVGAVEGELVSHLAVATSSVGKGGVEARAWVILIFGVEGFRSDRERVAVLRQARRGFGVLRFVDFDEVVERFVSLRTAGGHPDLMQIVLGFGL